MKKTIVALCLLAPLPGQVAPGFALPANEYVCKVQTRSLQTGVVRVQADDLPNAEKVASAVNALRLDGVAEQVKTVLECLPFPQQRFSDSALQAFIDAMPR